MRMTVYCFLLPVLLGAATGCAQMGRIEDDVDQLNATTQSLEREQKVAGKQLDDIQAALRSEGITSDEDRADLLSRFSAMERSVAQLEARVEDQAVLLRRIQTTLEVIAAGGGLQGGAQSALPDSSSLAPAGASGGADPAEGADPEAVAAGAGAGLAGGDSAPLDASGSPGAEVYDAAFRDFTKGNYTLARDGFEEFLTRYPDTDLADNARYWVGETWYAQGNYQEAVDHFDAVLRDYPQGDILPAALLKASNCRLELGEVERALEGYRKLVADYPDSDEAFIAQYKISEIGK
jgi:tol-pal system protein YbgF